MKVRVRTNVAKQRPRRSRRSVLRAETFASISSCEGECNLGKQRRSYWPETSPTIGQHKKSDIRGCSDLVGKKRRGAKTALYGKMGIFRS